MGELMWCVAAGGGTVLGALALMLWRRPSDRAFDLTLSAGAGIMLAATVLGLLPGALIDTPFWKAAVGFTVGVALIAACDARIPHWHARFTERRRRTDPGVGNHDRFTQSEDADLPDHLKKAVLLTAAISLHNFPEGAAIGVSFASGSDLGMALAIAILVHNIPEGLAVALPMRAMGMSWRKTIFWTSMTGVVEIAGALIAYALGSQIQGLLPFGLAFAAGAMLYVIIDEMIPQSHARGERQASLLFLLSFGLMAALMAALGSIPF